MSAVAPQPAPLTGIPKMTAPSHAYRSANRSANRSMISTVTVGNRIAYQFTLVLVLAALMFQGLCRPAAAEPATGARPAPLTLEAFAGAGLLFRTERPGLYLPAPTLETRVRGRVSGMIARIEVAQTFENPFDEWQEGVYVFPLPEDAAVDSMRLRIGERLIEGQIAERAEAKRTYQAARDSGTKASLVEQERPNIFTVSVANIGAGEAVSVEIAYLQTLKYDHGAFRLRFPMVVGPRYIPGDGAIVGVRGSAWGEDTGEVPDASRITPPVRRPEEGRANPLSLEIEVTPGFAVGEIKSPTHRVAVSRGKGERFTVTLDGGEVPADSDFELAWRPRSGTAPAAGLFSERVGEEYYALLVVTPPEAPEAPEAPERLPREAVFVIDTSGSMHGASIEQAKAALTLALTRLLPGDRFNVIQFNDQPSALFRAARPVERSSLKKALRYVGGLEAEGGTEILSALRMALDGGEDPGRLRQVIFLTDGAVGNERALFDWIAGHIGDSRLFTIGIGSAPNGYFMRKAAALGRGTFTYVGATDEVGEKMALLFEKLERPVLTDLAVRWPAGSETEAWPRRLPDLYHGEPVVVSARLTRLSGEVEVSGRLAGRPWRTVVSLGGKGEDSGVATVWARAKIEAVLDTLHQGADPAQVRRSVLAVALPHRLLTAYTSMVAVDLTPSRPVAEPLNQRSVATNLPRGWDYDQVFGEQSAQPSGLRKAAVKLKAPVATIAYQLPRTATPAPLNAVLGALLLLLASGLFLWTRRRA